MSLILRLLTPVLLRMLATAYIAAAGLLGANATALRMILRAAQSGGVDGVERAAIEAAWGDRVWRTVRALPWGARVMKP